MSKTPKNDRPGFQRPEDRDFEEESVDYSSTQVPNRQRRTTRESHMDDSEKADDYYYGLSDERRSDRE